MKIFSDKEKALFNICGLKHYVELVERDLWKISNFYEKLGEIVFLADEPLEKKHTDSLRRILKAWHNMKPFRHTKEFDDLIELYDDNNSD